MRVGTVSWLLQTGPVLSCSGAADEDILVSKEKQTVAVYRLAASHDRFH